MRDAWTVAILGFRDSPHATDFFYAMAATRPLVLIVAAITLAIMAIEPVVVRTNPLHMAAAGTPHWTHTTMVVELQVDDKILPARIVIGALSSPTNNAPLANASDMWLHTVTCWQQRSVWSGT